MEMGKGSQLDDCIHRGDVHNGALVTLIDYTFNECVDRSMSIGPRNWIACVHYCG